MLGKLILLGVIILGAIGSMAFFFIQADKDGEEGEDYITSSTGEKIEIQTKEDSVNYDVLFDAVWNPDKHKNIPTGAHFSPFVVWTHKPGVNVFEVGREASEGVRLMAETGGTEILKKELEQLKKDGKVGEYSVGKLIYSPAQAKQDITADQDFRYISFVSMIAPSPDWFVAVKDIDLFKDREWRELKNIPLVVYDAGTDSGEVFTSADKVTDPQGLIHPLLEDGVDVEAGGGTIANISLTRSKE